MSYDAKVRTLGSLLGADAKPILVPNWQRNFSWKSTEVQEFWADLIACVDGLGEKEQLGSRKYFPQYLGARTPGRLTGLRDTKKPSTSYAPAV